MKVYTQNKIEGVSKLAHPRRCTQSCRWDTQKNGDYPLQIGVTAVIFSICVPDVS